MRNKQKIYAKQETLPIANCKLPVSITTLAI